MTLKIQRLTPTAALPERATGQSAGLDLRADIGQAVTLPPAAHRSFPQDWPSHCPKERSD